MKLDRVPVRFTVLAALLAVGGCGGGGGGVGEGGVGGGGGGGGSGGGLVEPQPQAPQQETVCIPTHSRGCLSPAEYQSYVEPLADAYRDDAAFRNQWGLDDIGAHRAYAHVEALEGPSVEPGAGVTIGFIDTGIDRHHEMFAGASIAEEFHFGATDETVLGFAPGDASHGTAVASIAAGRPTSVDPAAAQGVAWGADIAMFAIPLGSGGGDYVPVSLAVLAGDDAEWAGLYDRVLRRDVDVMNLSFGFQGIIDSYGAQDLRASFGRTIAALAQQGASEKIIFVWAAGNAHGRPCTPPDGGPHCVNGGVDAVSVEVMAGLAARFPELRGHTVAVVALEDGPSGPGIAGFSNRCGIAADYCIAAPGDAVRYAFFGAQGRGIGEGAGTSFAAPMVAGGLAIMKQLFRDQLSNTELVERLLVTADDTGRFANRAVYGRGMMDLGAATSPVGVLDVPAGSRVGDPGVALQRTALRTGGAIGDGLAQSFAGREIVALDDLGAPFWFELDALTGAAVPSMSARMHEFLRPTPGALLPDEGDILSAGDGVAAGGAGTGGHVPRARWRLGFLERGFGGEGSHLGLAAPALAITLTDRRMLSGTAFSTGGELDRAPASGAALSFQPSGFPLGLRAGWVEERDTMLGSTTDGAFGALAAGAVFAGIQADAELGGWRIGASAEIGTVDPEASGGLITEITPLTTSAFGLHASRALADEGAFRLSVSQPLRVEHGRASLSVPTGRTKEREVVRLGFSADLAPSGRQLDVAAHWTRPVAVGELRLGAVVSREPGHRAGEDAELTLLSGWRWTF